MFRVCFYRGVIWLLAESCPPPRVWHGRLLPIAELVFAMSCLQRIRTHCGVASMNCIKTKIRINTSENQLKTFSHKSLTWRWARLVHCGGRGGSSREKVEDETLLTLPLKLKHILNCMSIHEVYCPVHIQIGLLQAKNIKLVSKREMNVVIVCSPPVTRCVTCCHRQGRSILSTHLH